MVNHIPAFFKRKLWAITRKFNIGKKSVMATSDLFLKQFANGEFRGYKVIVRCLAIEQYIGKNDYGFDLYEKLRIIQEAMANGDDVKAALCSGAAPRRNRDTIIKLAKSFEKNGFKKNSFISLDRNQMVIDGEHRLAMAICYDIQNVNVIRLYPPRPDFPVRYDPNTIDWYKDWFSVEEIGRIKAKTDEISSKFKKTLNEHTEQEKH